MYGSGDQGQPSTCYEVPISLLRMEKPRATAIDHKTALVSWVVPGDLPQVDKITVTTLSSKFLDYEASFSVPATWTSAIVPDLSPGRSYVFSVQSNGGGREGPNSILSAPLTMPDRGTPTAPKTVMVVEAGENSLAIEWSCPSAQTDAVTSFQVLWRATRGAVTGTVSLNFLYRPTQMPSLDLSRTVTHSLSTYLYLYIYLHIYLLNSILSINYHCGTAIQVGVSPIEATALRATITGLQSATSYQFQVAAVNVNGTGAFSEPSPVANTRPVANIVGSDGTTTVDTTTAPNVGITSFFEHFEAPFVMSGASLLSPPGRQLRTATIIKTIRGTLDSFWGIGPSPSSVIHLIDTLGIDDGQSFNALSSSSSLSRSWNVSKHISELLGASSPSWIKGMSLCGDGEISLATEQLSDERPAGITIDAPLSFTQAIVGTQLGRKLEVLLSSQSVLLSLCVPATVHIGLSPASLLGTNHSTFNSISIELRPPDAHVVRVK